MILKAKLLELETFYIFKVIKHESGEGELRIDLERSFYISLKSCWVRSHLGPRYVTLQGELYKVLQLIFLKTIGGRNTCLQNILISSNAFPYDVKNNVIGSSGEC